MPVSTQSAPENFFLLLRSPDPRITRIRLKIVLMSETSISIDFTRGGYLLRLWLSIQYYPPPKTSLFSSRSGLPAMSKSILRYWFLPDTNDSTLFLPSRHVAVCFSTCYKMSIISFFWQEDTLVEVAVEPTNTDPDSLSL